MVSLLTDQSDLLVQLKTIFDNKSIVLKSLTGHEALSELFEFRIVFASKTASFDIEKALGSNITVTLKTPARTRFINGIIAEFSQGGTQKEDDLYLTEYEAVIRPTLWLLTLDRNSLVFQNKKIIDIIKEVLKDGGVKDVEYKTRSGGNTMREYCVQYNESNFNFISRLMEDEGIFYFFKHTDGKHTLVLSDSESAYAPINGEAKVEFLKNTNSSFRMGYVFNTTLCTSLHTGEYSLADYNYTISQTKLFQKVKSKWKGGMYYDYPGGFAQSGEAQTFAKTRIEAFEFRHKMLKGNSTVFPFTPGATFKLNGHHAGSFNSEYAIYKVEHFFNFADENGFFYKNYFEAFPKTVVFRPARKSYKPKISGSQTAVVTTSSDKEEVLRDKFCGVKVQFHWDQKGEKNEKTSCWVRVGQLMAGNGWGTIFLPRIGQEVIVSFLDGDPDRPLIVGGVYNDKFVPPYAESDPLISTIKTTHLEADKERGFNELRLTDIKDKEEFFIHAHKDMVVDVVNERRTIIEDSNDSLEILKGNRSIRLNAEGDDPVLHSLNIVRGDSTVELTEGNSDIKLVKGNSTIELTEGNSDIKLVKGNSSFEIVEGDMSVKISKGKQDTYVQGNCSLTVDGNLTIKVKGNISMQADKDFSVKAKNVKIEAGGTATYKSKMATTISADQAGSGKIDIKSAAMSPISITSGKDIKIDAGPLGKLDGKGMNVQFTGMTGMKLMGTAGVDITSGAMAKVVAAAPINMTAPMISIAGMVKLG